MTSEVVINGIEYRTGQLNAKQQFHVARRLLPIIAKVGALSPPVQAPKGGEGEEPASAAPADVGEVFTSQFFSVIAESLLDLSDNDCDYIIDTCMSVVSRKQNDRWVPAWNRAANIQQFADLDVITMIHLTILVIQDNLQSFTNAPPQVGAQIAAFAPNIR